MDAVHGDHCKETALVQAVSCINGVYPGYVRHMLLEVVRGISNDYMSTYKLSQIDHDLCFYNTLVYTFHIYYKFFPQAVAAPHISAGAMGELGILVRVL